MMTPGTYDEALIRYHSTGPEFDKWLSNHGPMVVEALARRGESDRIHAWTDWYSQRLDERPSGTHPIAPEAWRDPLGDPTRTGDWIDLMLHEVREQSWQDALATWWPRLLPGIAAGATHGVIRVGHAVQALAAHETEPRLDELAHGLAYWAARWQPVPTADPAGRLSALDALMNVPTVPEQTFGIRSRLAQLSTTVGWGDAVNAFHPSTDPMATLDTIVDAAVTGYSRYGHGHGTMLVHSATAPAAVARVLPYLPNEFAGTSVASAWIASCAVVAAYRPKDEALRKDLSGRTADDLWQAALDNGDEHVIKFADTALAATDRNAKCDGLVATAYAIELHS